MRISDWSSDVCSSDLCGVDNTTAPCRLHERNRISAAQHQSSGIHLKRAIPRIQRNISDIGICPHGLGVGQRRIIEEDIQTAEMVMGLIQRSEEHTSELQSLMRISYAVFCLKKKKKNQTLVAYNATLSKKLK